MSKIKITYPFAVAVAILVFFDSQWQLFSLIAGVLIHESGHITAMWLCNAPYDAIEIGIKGAVIRYGKGRLTSYKTDIVIAAMGCIFNLFAIIIASFIAKTTGTDLTYFIGVNAAFMLFNSIPALPLDGGKVLYGLLSQYTSVDIAQGTLGFLTIMLSLTGIVLGGVVMALTGHNFTLLLISIYIFTAYWLDRRRG